jgi:hypothetical protein
MSRMDKIITAIAVFVVIFCVYLNSTGVRQFNFKLCIVSPGKGKFITKQGEKVLIVNAKNGRKIIKRKNIVDDHKILRYRWLNNDEVLVETSDLKYTNAYKTKDFRRYELINKIKHGRLSRISPDYRKFLFQDDNGELAIEHSNGLIWKTGLVMELTGYDWSNDGRYIRVLNEDEQSIIDTNNQYVNKMDKRFSGYWAPTRNIHAFYTNSRSRGFEKNCFYLFEPETVSYMEVNLTGIDRVKSYVWSQDSEYIAIMDWKSIFVIKTKNPHEPPKKIYDFEEHESVASFSGLNWTKDSKGITFVSHKLGRFVTKPMNFYATKVNIETGESKKVYIDGLLYEDIYWADDNVLYYELDHKKGLFRKKLPW